MMFAWLRERRRRAIRDQPFPPVWNDILARNVRQTVWLDEDERDRLRGWVAVFLAEKSFEGCRGMEITDEVRVSIAGQAGLVALGLPGEFFARLQSVFPVMPLAGVGASTSPQRARPRVRRPPCRSHGSRVSGAAPTRTAFRRHMLAHILCRCRR
jgi:hypothetical protein